MKKIPFTVSARTAKLIGRENVANADGAVIELVKNCYDADSKIAMVYVNQLDSSIIIIDNGSGMTEDDILNKWMIIGTANKESDIYTTSGRIKAGAKGIGRFALDRLGQKCTLFTFSNPKKGYEWTVNWNEFEKPDSTINNVYAELNILENRSLKDIYEQLIKNKEVINSLSNYTFNRGTIIKIQLLRDIWDTEFCDKLFSSLELLTPPDGQFKFDIFFFTESNVNKYGKINNDSFQDYDYKLVATYKKNNAREVNVSVHRNEFDYTLIESAFFTREDMQEYPFDKRTFKKEKFSLITNFYELVSGFRSQEKKNLSDTIGDFTFILYFYKLGPSDEAYKTKNADFTTRRLWSKKFGGIKLYRDNFRVRPYGEIETAAYDWLMLGERQGKNPAGASRLSFMIKPNQIAGTVNFSRKSELFLVDKSGREGLIENKTFDLFKNLLNGIISLLETDRSTIISNLADYEREINKEDIIEDEADKIASEDATAETNTETKRKNKTLKQAFKLQKAKIKQKDDELVLTRALASAGILIASFAHEFHSIKNKLNNRSTNLKSSLLPLLSESKTKNLPNLKNPYYLLVQFKELDTKIKQWIEFSLLMTKKDRRKSKVINLRDYFIEFKSTWKNKLSDRGISLSVSYDTEKINDYKVKMIELDLDTIFDNLLVNSIEAFQTNGFKGNRIINIELNSKNKLIDIKYSDSGPGLNKDIKRPQDIFKPFVTTKRDNTGKEVGSGLGMWLLKSAIDYNKGSVKLRHLEKGFTIILTLKNQSYGQL